MYADVNVNMLSTMSLDFILFDKPVVNTVFGNKENTLYDDQRFLNYVHYKYVVNSKAVAIAKSEKELHYYLNEDVTHEIETAMFHYFKNKKIIKGTTNIEFRCPYYYIFIVI